MPRGGKRAGAGRKKETPKTRAQRQQQALEKEVLREQARAIIAPYLKPLLLAQVANAQGLKYLVTRDKKTGKFIRVTEGMAKAKSQLGEHEEIIEVWEKDPSVQAFTDLINRLIDKPADQPQQLKVQHQFKLEDIIVGAAAP